MNNQIEELRQEALEKVEPNYLIIEMAYDKKIILPFDEGMALMSFFKNAERYNKPYSADVPEILPLDSDFPMEIISKKTYVDIKMKALLHAQEVET